MYSHLELRDAGRVCLSAEFFHSWILVDWLGNRRAGAGKILFVSGAFHSKFTYVYICDLYVRACALRILDGDMGRGIINQFRVCMRI